MGSTADAGAGELEGRVVLVTGAAQGIGRAVADAVSAEGAVAVACDLRPEVRELGASAWVADAASVADMERVVANAVHTYGRLDAVVAAAGAAELASPDGPAADAAELFDRMIEANLRTAYVTVRAALAHLATDGRGDIVLVSTDHVCPRPDARPKAGWMEEYDAAKWGLEGLQRNWATRLASRGIRVNSLAMGETDTPMLRTFLADRGVPSEQIDEMAHRWLTAADIAGVVVALLTEDAPSRTGTTIGLWPGFPVELPPL
jgi:NAD(P)-dependent dehydrogenase (short-subunit alcohol dehydrogenase family)